MCCLVGCMCRVVPRVAGGLCVASRRVRCAAVPRAARRAPVSTCSELGYVSTSWDTDGYFTLVMRESSAATEPDALLRSALYPQPARPLDRRSTHNAYFCLSTRPRSRPRHCFYYLLNITKGKFVAPASHAIRYRRRFILLLRNV